MITEKEKRYFFDLISASISWIIFFYYRKVEIENVDFEYSTTFLYGTIVVSICWMIFYFLSGNYLDVKRVSRLDELYTTLLQSTIGSLIIFFTLIIDDIENYKNYKLLYEALFILVLTHFSITFIPRYFLTLSIVKKIKNKTITFKTLLIGDTETIQEIIKTKENLMGHELIGYINCENQTIENSELPNIGNVDQLESILENHHVEEAIITFKKEKIKTYIDIINSLICNDIITKVRPDIADLLVGRVQMQSFFDLPFIEIKQIKMSFFESNLKRGIDVFMSISILMILSPVLILIGLIVKLTSKGPIFYTQERLGLKKKPFNIIKFRSMKINAETDKPLLASEDDKRITKWGKIMRKYRLDELPQFYNVLIGEMSIIGPRPERAFFANKILEKANHYKLIYKVKPGITSWGMVKFGYAENVEEMIKRLKYDIIYLENLSLLNDFKVFILTIFIILQGRGK